MNFFGSESSSASTPASNGSSSNGLSSDGASGVSPPNPPSEGIDSSDGGFEFTGAGLEGPANFNLYCVSVTLLFELFFLKSHKLV